MRRRRTPSLPLPRVTRAARCWWLLRHLGHDLLRVIDSTGREADLNRRREQDEPVAWALALGQDPAQSSSIVLTTVTDVAGFSSFLGIATLLSGLLAK